MPRGDGGQALLGVQVVRGLQARGSRLDPGSKQVGDLDVQNKDGDDRDRVVWRRGRLGHRWSLAIPS